MEKNDIKLSKLSKAQLIEIIHKYEDELAVKEECENLLRVGTISI